MTSAYLLKYKDSLEKVYEWLEDDLSKEVFMAFLKSKLSGNSDYLSDVSSRSGYEYFNQIFGEFDQEIIVDGGAYIGDTYMEAVKNKIPFLKYYAFEPDEKSFKRLNENTGQDSRVIQISKGLYDSEQTLLFFGKGTEASQFQENCSSGVNTKVTSIDLAAYDATYIKLDVEGTEMKALKGAEKTIIGILRCCLEREGRK